jgi:hypothetical protein
MSEGLEPVRIVGGDYDGETWQVSIGQSFLYVPRLHGETLRFEFATYTRRSTGVMALAGMSDEDVAGRLGTLSDPAADSFMEGAAEVYAS